jgi:hypothetical protein
MWKTFNLIIQALGHIMELLRSQCQKGTTNEAIHFLFGVVSGVANEGQIAPPITIFGNEQGN